MIYLDNAATTWPKPAAVTQAVCEVIRGEYGNPGRGGHRMSLASAKLIYDCRCSIADMFGATQPENVVFTYNDTYALNMAIKSLAARGGHILISGIEHNSVLRPVATLAKRGINYGIFKASSDSDEVIRDIRKKLRPNTSIIVANHGSNICGLRLPIKEIGELCTSVRRMRHRCGNRTPLYFIVDAAQTAGCADINIEELGIDVLCASGHKGLYGPQGSGFVLFGERLGKNAEHLDTLIEGGSGISSREFFMPGVLPERFEAGTLSTPAIAGLKSGIDFVSERDPGYLYEQQCRLGMRVTDMLSGIRGVRIYMPETVGGTVLFGIDGISSEELAARLDACGICVRAGLHCSPLAHRTLGTPEDGAVRVSFGAFNTMEETERFYRELSAIARDL